MITIMETGISVGKHIFKILSNDSEIKKMVGSSIFPLVIKEETTFPFIVFMRDNISTEYCKDGRTVDTITISIYACATSYSFTIDVIERVRELFESRKDSFINSCRINVIEEDFNDGAYVQRIQLEVKHCY